MSSASGVSSPSELPERQLRVITAFADWCGGSPAIVVRAPGRVNLMGDHTDYNEGFVLPMAIDRAVWIAVRPRNDRQIRLYSLEYGESAEFDTQVDSPIAKVTRPEIPLWAEYVRGVVWALGEAGYPRELGWDGVITGNVPRGAGLSSSAAIELAVARAVMAVHEKPWEPIAMARVAQHAENSWVGVQCGLMDQLIVATGEPDHAVLIDCRSLSVRAVPLPDESSIVVLDTATRRDLASSAYNLRRQQCETAAKFLKVSALRDVTFETFDRKLVELEAVLGADISRRVRHVVTENARALATADALISGDLRDAGRLMAESHRSLRDDFEASRSEIDVMVRLAQEHPCCWGARMTGAGFGGCAVALTTRAGVEQFTTEVARAYKKQVGLTPALYICSAAKGASVDWSQSDS